MPRKGKPKPIACWWCGAESSRLCDTVLCKADDELRLVTDVETPETCDAPICDECTNAGKLLLCSRQGRANHRMHIDSIDFCPYCVATRKQPTRRMVVAEQHRVNCRAHARANFRPRLATTSG